VSSVVVVVTSLRFNVFEDVKDGVELKADSEDDENAVAQNVADLVGVKALDHDPDPHHHA